MNALNYKTKKGLRALLILRKVASALLWSHPRVLPSIDASTETKPRLALTPLWAAFALGLLVAVSATLGPQSHAFAQVQEEEHDALYSVEGLLVRALGRSGLEAREKAMRFGHISALRQVAERLVPEAQWGAIPTPSEKDFEAMVVGLDVSGEQQANTSYLGLMSLRFDPAKLHTFLADNGVEVAARAEKPLLLVLVSEDTNGEPILWDPEAAWLKAWQPSPLQGTVLPSTQIGGDLQDREILDTTNALAPTPDMLAALREAYQADALLYANARELTGSGADIARLEVILRQDGELPRLASQVVTCERQSDEAARVFYRRCASQVASLVLEAWKTEHRQSALAEIREEIPASQLQRIPVFALVLDPSGFAFMQQKVLQAPNVRALSLIEQRQNGAIANLDFVGQVTDIVQQLPQVGVNIFRDQGVIYLQFNGR